MSMGLAFRCGGLIPAWAGKTSTPCGASSPPWAHPRVGGENNAVKAAGGLLQGSSPRGRGKPTPLTLFQAVSRLIPAWAGKTAHELDRPGIHRAHPRVGGENLEEDSGLVDFLGSSPRGRGKPHHQRHH